MAPILSIGIRSGLNASARGSIVALRRYAVLL